MAKRERENTDTLMEEYNKRFFENKVDFFLPVVAAEKESS